VLIFVRFDPVHWAMMAMMREEYETVDHYISKLTEICREYIRRLEDLEVLGITEEEYEQALIHDL